MFRFCLSVEQLHNDIVSGLSPSRQDMQCTATGTVPTADWDLLAMLVLTAMSRKPKARSSFVLLPLGLSVSSVCYFVQTSAVNPDNDDEGSVAHAGSGTVQSQAQ